MRTRPPVKQDAIIAHVRDLIVRGKLAPGDRLPPRTTIEESFQVSIMTVQRAFERLVEDGFITVADGQGSFVAAAPPHLHRYALVFPFSPGELHWVRFWALLKESAQAFALRAPARLAIYEGVERDRTTAGFQRLSEDVARQRLAGIIFASDPWPLKGTAILDAPGIPRVAFSGLAANTQVPGISLGGDGSFFTRAIDHLVARGRRRIGLLTVPGLSGAHLDVYRAALGERGLPYQPGWVQVGIQSDPQWAAHLVHAMFRGPASDRPDALIIADDNLVDHACAGLIQLGLQVPDDLDVVAHANFPVVCPAILPVTRLGYRIPDLVAACIDQLARMRAGAAVPAITIIAPRFADEWAGATLPGELPTGALELRP